MDDGVVSAVEDERLTPIEQRAAALEREMMPHRRLGPSPESLAPDPKAAERIIGSITKALRESKLKTRCKFQVTEVAHFAWPGEKVTLCAVYGGSAENQSFAAATPNGSVTITVTNPNVIGTFKPGAYYYLDLIPSEA